MTFGNTTGTVRDGRREIEADETQSPFRYRRDVGTLQLLTGPIPAEVEGLVSSPPRALCRLGAWSGADAFLALAHDARLRTATSGLPDDARRSSMPSLRPRMASDQMPETASANQVSGSVLPTCRKVGMRSGVGRYQFQIERPSAWFSAFDRCSRTKPVTPKRNAKGSRISSNNCARAADWSRGAHRVAATHSLSGRSTSDATTLPRTSAPLSRSQ